MQFKFQGARRLPIILGGYTRPFGKTLWEWTENGTLKILETKPSIKGTQPYLLSIPKENVIAFMMTGDRTVQSKVSGGGVSLGGAVVGAAIAGPVGAIIGGRKKVKTETQTFDTRRLMLKFRENGEITIQLGPQPYNDLCMLCMEKQI